jgi:hypothetical protein
VEEMFADSDRVISQLAMEGTQTGEFHRLESE